MEEWMVLGERSAIPILFPLHKKWMAFPTPHPKIEEWWMVSLLFWMATQVCAHPWSYVDGIGNKYSTLNVRPTLFVFTYLLCLNILS